MPALTRWLQRRLAALHLGSAELSVLLANDPTLRRLNRMYRNRDRATDVLSFSMREYRRPEDPLPPQAWVLGDLVISLDQARRQARERGTDLESEVHCLLIHGLLHLLGYDHVRPLDAKRMFTLQASLLAGHGRKRRHCGPVPGR